MHSCPITWLFSLSSLIPCHCLQWRYRGSGITLTKNGITVQISVLQPCCVWMLQSIVACAVYVCGGSMYAWKEQCIDGRVTSSTRQFLTADVEQTPEIWHTVIFWEHWKSQEGRPVFIFWHCLKYRSKMENLSIRKSKSRTNCTRYFSCIPFVQLVLISNVICCF